MKIGDCWECGSMNVEINHHHPVPRVRGGTKTIPLCLMCHAKAHHRKKRMSSNILSIEGLKRAKARGVKLGNPNLSDVRPLGWEANRAKADNHANQYMDVIKAFRRNGKSYGAIANVLNDMGAKTSRGGKWYSSTVRNIEKRLDKKVDI